MKKAAMLIAAAAIIVLGPAVTAFSHCEIPCGIYDDGMRIRMMEENVATIEKSMNMIVELSKDADKNYNQLVRWVDNKEHHAEKLQEIVWQYFMTQRIKPVDASDAAGREKYLAKLELLHLMLVHAMKAKQTTDLEHVETLRSLIADFDRLYFEKEPEMKPKP